MEVVQELRWVPSACRHLPRGLWREKNLSKSRKEPGDPSPRADEAREQPALPECPPRGSGTHSALARQVPSGGVKANTERQTDTGERMPGMRKPNAGGGPRTDHALEGKQAEGWSGVSGKRGVQAVIKPTGQGESSWKRRPHCDLCQGLPLV